MYKIIDLKNKNITTAPVVIKGLYEEIESSLDVKLLTHIVLDNVDKANAFVHFNVMDGAFYCDIYGGTLFITNDDEVTFAI